ncbi:MAG: T9SS type A sorting domain-containing protein [Candidatus Delongbacteria bacterium]|jgi:hypothetical protein|nr:T9SS type A sorting domain-containing protein [Candidatus Delongbacteria bacterium]
MKRILVFVLVVSLFFVLFAQKKILIDNIHGADFIGMVDSTGITSIGIPIDFNTIFPDGELTILQPDSLPFDSVLVQETTSGVNAKTYTVNLPDGYYPENPHCLYVYVECLSEDFLKRARGTVKNPEGEVVGELFQGSSHVENALGDGWQINLYLDSLLTYDVKIGYGKLLFSSSGLEGKYNLNDFDIMIRINDNCGYAIVGNAPLCDDNDLAALSEAFTSGLSFINADHYYDSMTDKPFIHFYSDDEINIDVNIEFPGNYTLLSSNPRLNMSKSDNIMKSTWEGHKLNINSDNEIIYEGGLKNKLNFLGFKFFGEQITVKNKLGSKLDDIFILKYESENLYRFQNISELTPLSEAEILDWKYLDTDQIIEKIKKVFFERGLEEGLYYEEIDHLVNDFHWIESLLYRAKINKDEYFGFYHFGKDVYDKFIGFKSEPYPEELNRTMWVMLSFIKERDDEPIITLDREVYKTNVKNGLKINEYGVTDEYYTNSYFKSENDLFGIEINSYTDQFMINSLHYYDNDVASSIFFGSYSMMATMGIYDYVCDDYVNMGVLYQDGNQINPVSYGHVINENGQLLVIGTSSFFRSDDPNGHSFLNSVVTELVDNRILTGIESASNVITDFDLQAYPNPFNPSTLIEFSLKKDAFVELIIYNSQGQEVKQIVNSSLGKGVFRHEFNAKDQASGLYTCILKVDNDVVDTKKMMLLK